ncbi:NAD(P)H-binding protein [Streptomyces sp. 3211]|uniref:NAD(P)H-binding protein n=1 Tax=Streptomyces sp. 3211 TaxID=1964449 RepID=UPI0009A52A92|nr:NAD(P)H-binding protein [Streptomyces sp. 3211]
MDVRSAARLRSRPVQPGRGRYRLVSHDLPVLLGIGHARHASPARKPARTQRKEACSCNSPSSAPRAPSARLSALGSGDTARRQSHFQAWAAKLVMGALMADKGIADETIARSDRDWTIALPLMFANGPTTAGYRTIPLDGTRGRVGGRINRADVADFLLSAATGERWVRRRVILTR